MANGDDHDAGIIFPSLTVSSVNDGGYQYYVGLYPNSDEIKFGKIMNSWNVIKTKSVTIDTNVIYVLRVEA